MLEYHKGEWIRTSHLGAVEIIGRIGMGLIVAWGNGGMGRRIVDWSQVERENPQGSVKGEFISDDEIR